MTERTKFADVEWLQVQCRSGRASVLLLALADGSTVELRGAAMRSWLDAWSRLWNVPPSLASNLSSRQTSLVFGRRRSGKAQAGPVS